MELVEVEMKQTLKIGIMISIPLSILMSMMFLAFFAQYFFPGFSIYPEGFINGAYKGEISKSDLVSLNVLIKNGVILTPNDLLQNVSEFYSSLMIILTTILTILGVIAFITIKAISQDAAERMAENSTKKAVENHFRSTEFSGGLLLIAKDEFKPIMNKIETQLQEFDNKSTDFDELAKTMSDLKVSEDRLADIENNISVISMTVANLDSREELTVSSNIEVGSDHGDS